MSPDHIIVNGVSSNTLNLWMDTPPVPPMARQKYTTWASNNDTMGTTPDNVFEDSTYTVQLYAFKPDNYDNTSVYSFFSDVTTLEISRHPGYYYKVKQTAVSSDEDYDGNRIKYTVTFKLSPFRYSVENPEITVSKGEFITNNGTRYSKPYYQITGSGTVNFYVNGKLLKIADLDGVINIDCERMVAYAPDGTNLLPKTTGELPFLASGANQITWSGTVSSVKLRVNERWY